MFGICAHEGKFLIGWKRARMAPQVFTGSRKRSQRSRVWSFWGFGPGLTGRLQRTSVKNSTQKKQKIIGTNVKLK
jgi:hypothetical protein